jgi:hypothetical protein
LYDIPDYVLILLKLNGFTSEKSLRGAASDGLQSFLDVLGNCGKKILDSSFYSEDIKNQFSLSCSQSFVDSSNFEILRGTSYLLKELLDDISRNKFDKKKSENVTKSREEKDSNSGSYYTDENIQKLNQLLRRNWLKENIPHSVPDNFSVSVSSTSSWSVSCPMCPSNFKVFLKPYQNSVQFNTSYFNSHLKQHKISSRNSSMESSSNEELSHDSSSFSCSGNEILTETPAKKSKFDISTPDLSGSPDAFFSFEINTFMLLKLILLCRDTFGNQFFIIFLMNSQICEKLFRILRSMTTTLSTIVNFSPLEILERMRRIQLQAELINDYKNIFDFGKNSEENFEFTVEEMPTDFELEEAITKAYESAKAVACKLGLFIEERQFEKCKMYPPPEKEQPIDLEAPLQFERK